MKIAGASVSICLTWASYQILMMGSVGWFAGALWLWVLTISLVEINVDSRDDHLGIINKTLYSHWLCFPYMASFFSHIVYDGFLASCSATTMPVAVVLIAGFFPRVFACSVWYRRWVWPFCNRGIISADPPETTWLYLSGFATTSLLLAGALTTKPQSVTPAQAFSLQLPGWWSCSASAVQENYPRARLISTFQLALRWWRICAAINGGEGSALAASFRFMDCCNCCF